MFYFVFDSADKKNVLQYGTGYYSLLLNSQIVCSKLSISNIIIPRSFYNVYSANNTIYINGISINLLQGNYSLMGNNIIVNTIYTGGGVSTGEGGGTSLPVISQNLSSNTVNNTLLSVLGATIIAGSAANTNTQSQSYTLTVNPNTGRVNISTTNTNNIVINFGTAHNLFGMEANLNYNLSASSSINSPYIYDLNSIPAVYIRSSNIHSNFVYNNNLTTILYRLPVDQDFGKLLIYNNQSKDFAINVNNITQLDLRLTDNFNNEISLNGQSFKIQFFLE